MEAEIARQNKIQSSIRQENCLLQKSASNLKDQIAHLSTLRGDLQTEELQLRKAVVRSPVRVKADLRKAEKNLKQIKMRIQEKEKETNELERKVESIVKGTECVRAAMVAMENLDEMVRKYDIAVEDADDMREQVQQLERSLERKMTLKEEQEVEFQVIGMCICFF